MQYFKLQLGCLLIIAYIEISYIRATLRGKIPCNRFYDALMVVAPQIGEMMQGFKMPAQAPAVPAAPVASGWDCPACGTKNIQSRFCPDCGSKKPEPKAGWDCPNCAEKNIVSNFCPNCGAKKPALTWD